MKLMRLWWLLWVFSIPALGSERTIAEQEKQYQDHLNWAKGAQQSIPDKAKGQLNIADYCDDAECIRQVHNPPQKALNNAAIERQKAPQFLSNPTAGSVKSSFDKGRPTLSADPAFQFSLLGQSNAYEITHGISNPYVDCERGTQCIIEQIARQCHRPTHNTVPCNKVPIATVVSRSPIYYCPSGWTKRGVQCERTVQQCRYDGANLVTQAGGNSTCPSIGTSYVWNGKRVTPSQGFRKGALKKHINWGGCKGTNWRKNYEICGPIKQTIRANMRCSPGYTPSGRNCVKNIMTWRTQCQLLDACQVVSQRCIEGAATRIINGIPTRLNCWKYQVNHRCDFPDSCARFAPDCKISSTRCKTLQNGVCVEEEVHKSCPRKTCSATRLECLEVTFCLDGDCYDATPSPSDDFNKSAAGLAALSDAAKGLGDPPLIFKGTGMQCTDKAFGFADCCKDSGWGTDVGLARCSDDEKALGQAKQQGLTIALGSYCAKKVLGACLRKKKGYCVFDSKLARIVQEQGVRSQLGLSLGSAKSPQCNAITPEQLQKINFSRIDFSEFYRDMHSNTNLPSAREIQERLRSSYQP